MTTRGEVQPRVTSLVLPSGSDAGVETDRNSPSIDLPRNASGVDNAEALSRVFTTSTSRRGLAFLRRALVRILALVVFVALWQVASTHKARFVVNFAFVPAPTAVAVAALEFVRSAKAPQHVLSSVRRVLIGFALAAAVAIPLGLAIGRSRLIADIVMTPLEVLRPIPGVAWIPLAILMFPTSEQSMIFICLIGALFPILLSTIHGVENLDRRLVYAAQTLGARNWHIFTEVIFPGALPSIVTGLTIGMGISWFLVVTAEMISGRFGVGYFTWEAYTLQNYADIVVGMVVIGVLGMSSSLVVKFLGGRFMPWHRHLVHAR
jgi:NitT/TauT family transport system permease protein